jgi:hypothetical protein
MARRGSVFLTAAVLALVLCAAGTLPGQAKVALMNEDCSKCHAQQPADIEKGGGRHQSDIGCQDCHNHPHDLNNFATVKPPAAAAPAAAPAEKN